MKIIRGLAVLTLLNFISLFSPAYGAAAYYTPVASVAALKAYGIYSNNIIHANVQGYYGAGTPGGGNFDWSPLSTATDDGGYTIQATAVTTGRWIRRPSNDGPSVSDFGAKCDNSSDDHVALQAGLTYAGANNLTRLGIPSFSCNTSTTLNVNYPIDFHGNGLSASQIKGVGLSGGAYVLNVDGSVSPQIGSPGSGYGVGYTIRDMTIASDNNSPNLIKWNQLASSRLINIGLRNAVNGLVITGTNNFSNSYENIVDLTSISNSTILFNSCTCGGQHLFSNISVGGVVGFKVDSGSEVTGITLVHPNLEGNSTAGIGVYGKLYGLDITGLRTEGGTGTKDVDIAPASGKFVYGVDISGFTLRNTAASTYGISLGGGAGTVSGVHIHGGDGFGYGTALVHNGSGLTNVVVEAVHSENANAVCDAVAATIDCHNNSNSAGAIDTQFNSPLAPPTYTVTNGSTSRSLNVGGFQHSTIGSGSAANITPSGTVVNVTSLSLAAGTWDLNGACHMTGGATTLPTEFICSITSSSGGLGTAGDVNRISVPLPASFAPFATDPYVIPIGPYRVTPGLTTTYYITAYCLFTVSTCAAFGTLQANPVTISTLGTVITDIQNIGLFH
jgi:hypothetical protein